LWDHLLKGKSLRKDSGQARKNTDDLEFFVFSGGENWSESFQKYQSNFKLSPTSSSASGV
jgi:hypothetical protein